MQIGVVQLVIEPQGMGVVQEDTELIGETTARKVCKGCHLLIHDMTGFGVLRVRAYDPGGLVISWVLTTR